MYLRPVEKAQITPNEIYREGSTEVFCGPMARRLFPEAVDALTWLRRGPLAAALRLLNRHRHIAEGVFVYDLNPHSPERPPCVQACEGNPPLMRLNASAAVALVVDGPGANKLLEASRRGRCRLGLDFDDRDWAEDWLMWSKTAREVFPAMQDRAAVATAAQRLWDEECVDLRGASVKGRPMGLEEAKWWFEGQAPEAGL